MCLTNYWIASEWNLHQRILNFYLVSNHKGKIVSKMVETCLLDWGIDHIFIITVDNLSSNDGPVRYLRKKTKDWRDNISEYEFIHVRCCAHIVKLVVNEGLEELNN